MEATNGSGDALYGVGCWLLDQERYEDAKHLFRTMLLVAPTDDRGWIGLGVCHERTSEIEKAAQLYSLAQTACAGSIRASIALGRALRTLGRDAEAAAAYAEAAERADAADDQDLASLIASEARPS